VKKCSKTFIAFLTVLPPHEHLSESNAVSLDAYSLNGMEEKIVVKRRATFERRKELYKSTWRATGD
jgi:hypothetical protein